MSFYTKFKNNTTKSFLQKAFIYIYRAVKNTVNERLDLYLGTTIKNHVLISNNSYFILDKMDLDGLDLEECSYIFHKYLNHEFDLLGSGWRNVNKGSSNGIYKEIDWHRDIVHGFRFNNKTWYKKIVKTIAKGVDIKRPWELGRLQHLPQLALFSKLDSNNTKLGLNEFKNQIIDFDDNNPARIGVNWTCTMDVAIRIANILIAYDMFKTLDSENTLNDEFHSRMSRMTCEHGLHIRNNLEKINERRNNHYLSNIVGLLFVSLYLEADKTTNEWLDFSINQLIIETEFQFYNDGGNFESSASYHALSSELVLYATSFLLSISGQRIQKLKSYLSIRNLKSNYTIGNDRIIFPFKHIEKLNKIGCFLICITNEHGISLNYGDNDNGKLFKFSPIGRFVSKDEYLREYELEDDMAPSEKSIWVEDELNFSPLLAIFSKVFNKKSTSKLSKFEYSIFKELESIPLFNEDKSAKADVSVKANTLDLAYNNQIDYELSVTSAPNTIAFYDSGVYLIKSDDFLFAIYATPLGQNGYGGHKHSDILSCELYSNGKWLIRDPGTYCYTSEPDVRDFYRSTLAHNAPLINGANPIVFTSPFSSDANCIIEVVCEENKISIVMTTDDIIIMRVVKFDNGLLTINDKANRPFEYSNFNYVSTGYGKRHKVKELGI